MSKTSDQPDSPYMIKTTDQEVREKWSNPTAPTRKEGWEGTDGFVKLLGVVKQWFIDEGMELTGFGSDFVAGRFASRVQSLLLQQKKELIGEILKWAEKDMGKCAKTDFIYQHLLKLQREA